MDISASLFSWLKLTGYLSEFTCFMEVGDSHDFINIFNIFFPEFAIDQNDSNESFSFLNNLIKVLPENYKANCGLSNVDHFERCDPEFLEEITKALFFSLNSKKNEQLMQQINRLEESERNDLLLLLNQQEEKKEVENQNNLNDFSEILRKFAKQLETSLDYDTKIQSIKQEVHLLRKQQKSERERISSELKEELEKRKQEISQKHQENEEIIQEIGDTQDIIHNLRREINEKGAQSTKLGDLSRENLSLKSSHSFIIESVEQLFPINEKYLSLEQQMKSKEQEINDLDAERSFLSETVSTVRKEVEDKEKQLLELEKMVEEKEQQIEDNIKTLKEDQIKGNTSKLLKELKNERMKRNEILEQKFIESKKLKNRIKYFVKTNPIMIFTITSILILVISFFLYECLYK